MFWSLTGKRGRLLSEAFSQNPELRRFLASDNTRYLSWLHDIGTGDFSAVSTISSSLFFIKEMNRNITLQQGIVIFIS